MRHPFLEKASDRMRTRILLKALSIGYVVFLTALLLTADPGHLIGFRGNIPYWVYLLMPSAHLLSFFVLTVLFLAARWPVPWWLWIALLIGYGAATEGTQGLFPPRTPEWADWFQDMVGVLLGAGFCGGVHFVLTWRRPRPLRS